MEMFHSNLLVPTNSRRRTKGRLPFIDSAEPVIPNEEDKLENEVNVPENELECDFSENLDDIDEEQVTIDLSEFLNENPLLTEPSENLADSAATLNDCHSQFRVTSSLADPTPAPIEEISSLKDSTVNESTVMTDKCSDISGMDTIHTIPNSEMPPKVLSENNISIDSTKIPTDIVDNISPLKENILIKPKSSPSKNHKAKATKVTNLFQKYKNASRLKDFNKNNMKVFGKYPVVKCEKLDIENFIKTNSIKVGNWPIRPSNNHFRTKSHINKSNNIARKSKSQSVKVPKLLNKPITFNRCIPNAQNLSTVNKARSILIDALAANSSPLIIKTDNWKPEIANLTGGSNKFNPESFQLPVAQVFNKSPGNQRIIKLIQAPAPFHINKLNNQAHKHPIITSVNKVTVGPKTFQLLSPPTFAASKPDKSKAVTPILPKPFSETISPLFLKDYTVIQPYVEDPTSPVKPKPLLTVPLDIVPVVNAFNQPELISAAAEIQSPIKSHLKSAKPVQSVFLNGAINRISSPVRIGKELSPINVTKLVHYNEVTTVSNDMNKANKQSKTDLSTVSPKSSMIDIVTSVFAKPQIKKQPKNKQSNPRSQRGGFSSFLECRAYNSTLNDMLFNDDFTDENYSLDDSFEVSSDNCPVDAANNDLLSSQANQSVHVVQEKGTESSSKEEKPKEKVLSKQKCQRKKLPSPHDSDTLSASEGEERNNPRLKRLSYTKRRHKRLSVNNNHNHKKPTESPNTISEFDDSQNISSEMLAADTSIKKNVPNPEKRNKLLQKAEGNMPSEDSPESLKSSKEKFLSSNKSSSSKTSLEESFTTSKSETNSISNGAIHNEEKVNVCAFDDAHKKPRTVKESKIGVNNLRSRHKSTLKCQTAVALVKSKRIGYVGAKFKIKSKKPSNSKAIRNNKKSSRPADIIKEIKTITGGSISSKRFQKKESTISEKDNHSSSSKTVTTRSKNEPKSKPVSKVPRQTKKGLAVRSKTKKRIKTLKVLFKRPNHKQKSKTLEMPFDDVNLALLDNENDPNSLSENNTNLNSTFRDEKSHEMGTPSKEENKCDADVLPTKLKSDDSLKENILKEKEMLSNGIDENSSIENSVGTEGGDFLYGENDISSSEELKSSKISDKVEMNDMPHNEKLNVSDKEPSDASSTNNPSSIVLQENNSDALYDSDCAMPSTEDESKDISENAGLDLGAESQAETFATSVHELSNDITNEGKIPSSIEIEEQDRDVDVNKNSKKDNVASTNESAPESGSNELLEDHAPDKNVCCDNSSEITSVSGKIQKLSYDSDNTVLGHSHESAQTCQEVPEYDNLDKMVENDKIKDTIEGTKTSEEPACGEIPGDAFASEEMHEDDNIHKNNGPVVNNENLSCKEMQKAAHDTDDNTVGENINELKVTYEEIPSYDSVSFSATNKIVSSCEKHQKDNCNSDNTDIQNELNDSKTGEDSPEIEKIAGKKRGRKPKRKSCPKIKISVTNKMDSSGSSSTSKNWYISERKESTDSTQSEEQPVEDKSDSSKREKEAAALPSSPVNMLGKDGHVSFETVAEVHAVETDTNPSCDKVPSEMDSISKEAVSDGVPSNSVKDNVSTVTSEIDKTSSVELSAVNSSNGTLANEDSSRSAKSFLEKKGPCSKPHADLDFKVKEEPMDESDEPVSELLNSTVNIKIEDEVSKPIDKITVDTTPLPSRRKGRSSANADKNLKLDLTPSNACNKNQVQKKVDKKITSNAIIDSPSEVPFKMPVIGEAYSIGTPASCPRNRKKNYSPEAVIVPFSLGWMRELVHRATEKRAGQKTSDVYYLSPEGTKLRSMIEVSNYLSKHPGSTLTIENFTYFKELIYREPFEIERSAKQKSSFGTSSVKTETSKQASLKDYLQSSSTPKGNKSSPTNSSAKKRVKTAVRSSDVNIDADESKKSSKLPVKSPVTPNAKKKADKSADDSSSIMDTVENGDNSKPSRRVVKKVPFDNSFDDKSQPRPKRGRPSKSLNASVPEPELTKTLKTTSISNQPNNSKNSVAGSSSTLSKNFSKSTAPTRRLKLVLAKSASEEIQPPCSPRCHIAALQPPSIQCAICLCFFHRNCIPKLAEKVIFACKACTTQKIALYEKERNSSSVAEPSLSLDDSIDFDQDIDISLLSPETLLTVQTEPITFPSASVSHVLPKHSSSNIPQGLSGTTSSAAAKNVLAMSSSPQLLSHLLQPTVVKTSLRPLAAKPANQYVKSPTSRVLLSKEAVARILQSGTHLSPGSNLSGATPLFIKTLPDGRRIALRGTSNLSTLTNSTLQIPLPSVNSSYRVLSNISEPLNGNILSSQINQTGNALLKNVNFFSPDLATNSIIANSLTNVMTGNEFSGSKNFKSSSSVNNASESSLSWDMNKLMTSCKSLLLVFKRLSIPDLLRARQVCSYWKYVASQSELWERVSFQGLSITDWERCCLALQKNGTKSLDLRGIEHQNVTNPWRDLESYVGHLAGIEELIFDQITPSLLKNVAYNMPLLRKLECHFVTTACSEPEIWTVTSEWELSSLRYLGRLVKLKIGSGSRIELKHGEDYVMPYLPQLRHVALTGFNFCSNVNLESLSKQKELISLELGDCNEVEPGIYALLENLTNLKSLRLENGGSIDDCRLSKALLKIKGLEVLELMNFKISKSLSETFKELKHLIHLNVWPDNTEKAAVVNRNLFDAIVSCQDLKYLCWGVIAEGEYIPEFLEMENSDELTFENLFNDLVALFPEGRVEVKCAPRNSWREFCSTRK